jgi:hypothetical protein
MTGQGKQHDHELYNLYSSPSISRVTKSERMRGVEHAAHIGYGTSAYTLVRRHKGTRPFGRTRHRWKGNIKSDFN